MRKSEELLPCPFCGSLVSLEQWRNSTNFFISHNSRGKDCPIHETYFFSSKEKAIEVWNKRTPKQAEAAK